MEKEASLSLDPLELEKLLEFISTLPNDSVLRSKLIEIVVGDEEQGRNSYEAQIRTAQLPVRGTGDILALAVHCEAKKRGLITTVKKSVPGGTVVPGFAPPVHIQDLEDSKLVPDDWQSTKEGNADGSCVFSYRYKSRFLKVRSLRVGESLVVHCGFESKTMPSQAIDPSLVTTIELDIPKHVTIAEQLTPHFSLTTGNKDLDFSFSDLTLLLRSFFPGVLPSAKLSSASETSTSAVTSDSVTSSSIGVQDRPPESRNKSFIPRVCIFSLQNLDFSCFILTHCRSVRLIESL